MKFAAHIAFDAACIVCVALSVGIGAGLYVLAAGFIQ